MRLSSVIAFIALFLFSACKKNENKKPVYNKGELTVVTDQSFESVTEALTEGYMIHYPETNLKVRIQKEDLALLELLQGKAKTIVLSRDLSTKEISEYETQFDQKFNPAYFAVDAVVFVVPKDSDRNSISMDEITEGMSSPEKPFIYDGTNSSNLNFVAQKLNRKVSDLQFNIISGNQSVAEQIAKYPGKIGVISLNTISRPYGKEAERLRSMLKILPVTDQGKSFMPDYTGLGNLSYPFYRKLYFLTNESGFNIANAFIRYSCTHLGQMIVSKEGLQKFNLYQREVQMN